MHLVLGQPAYIDTLHGRKPTYISRMVMQQPVSLFHEFFLKRREFASFKCGKEMNITPPKTDLT
jgi:hypothetical protein